MPLDRQKQVVDDIKAALKPPDGVSASVVGLPVLAAEANSALSSPWRRGLTLLAALAGVFLVLFAVRRSAREAAVPLIPIALATGWSGLRAVHPRPAAGPARGGPQPDVGDARRARDRDLDRVQRAAVGALPPGARRRGRARRSGDRADLRAPPAAAVLASGGTAIAGFAALIVSDIRMLRDFGIVTVVDLTVSRCSA